MIVKRERFTYKGLVHLNISIPLLFTNLYNIVSYVYDIFSRIFNLLLAIYVDGDQGLWSSKNDKQAPQKYPIYLSYISYMLFCKSFDAIWSLWVKSRPKFKAFTETITLKIILDIHSHHPCSFYELSARLRMNFRDKDEIK